MNAILPVVRIPVIRPPTPRPAVPWEESPAQRLQRHFECLHRDRMSDLPFLNARIGVEVVGCLRSRGDWLAALVTPWSIQLVLLPGGGELWDDLALGMRRTVPLPAGDVVFIGDEDEGGLGAFQYCPLIAPVTRIDDHATACRVAHDALSTAIVMPPATAGALPVATDDPPSRSRRAFLFARRN